MTTTAKNPANLGQPQYIWGTFEWAEVKGLFRAFKRNGHACVLMHACPGPPGSEQNVTWWMKIRIE